MKRLNRKKKLNVVCARSFAFATICKNFNNYKIRFFCFFFIISNIFPQKVRTSPETITSVCHCISMPSSFGSSFGRAFKKCNSNNVELANVKVNILAKHSLFNLERSAFKRIYNRTVTVWLRCVIKPTVTYDRVLIRFSFWPREPTESRPSSLTSSTSVKKISKRTYSQSWTKYFSKNSIKSENWDLKFNTVKSSS